MAYGVSFDFRDEFVCCVVVCDCVMVKDRFHRVLGLSKTEHCVSGQQNPEQNGKWGVPKFPHTHVSWPCQLWMAITFSSKLRFACS